MSSDHQLAVQQKQKKCSPDIDNLLKFRRPSDDKLSGSRFLLLTFRLLTDIFSGKKTNITYLNTRQVTMLNCELQNLKYSQTLFLHFQKYNSTSYDRVPNVSTNNTGYDTATLDLEE